MSEASSRPDAGHRCLWAKVAETVLWAGTAPSPQCGPEGFVEEAAATASKESLSVEKSARNRCLIRKIQRLEFSSVFNAAKYFRLPCMY